AVAEHRSAYLKFTDGLAVVRKEAAVIGGEPSCHAAHRKANVAGPALTVGPGTQRYQSLGHAVSLDRRVTGQVVQALEGRRRKRRAAGDEDAGVLQRGRRIRIVGD